jgi:hypothetical protein
MICLTMALEALTIKQATLKVIQMPQVLLIVLMNLSRSSNGARSIDWPQSGEEVILVFRVAGYIDTDVVLVLAFK